MRFSALPEVVRNKFIEAGCPIVLQCELSDPTAQVYWYKDGTKLLPQSGIEIQSDGITRTLVVQSAEIFYSGSYSCKTKGDAIKFNVDVKGEIFLFWALQKINKLPLNKATNNDGLVLYVFCRSFSCCLLTMSFMIIPSFITIQCLTCLIFDYIFFLNCHFTLTSHEIMICLIKPIIS